LYNELHIEHTSLISIRTQCKLIQQSKNKISTTLIKNSLVGTGKRDLRASKSTHSTLLSTTQTQMSKNVLNRKKKIQQAEEADDLSSTSSEDTIENKLPRPQNFIYAPSASSTLNLVEQSEEGKVRRRKRSSTSLLYNNDAEVVNTRRVKNRFLNIPNMEENKFIKPKGNFIIYYQEVLFIQIH